MAENRLNIINKSEEKEEEHFISRGNSPSARRNALKAKFERLWLIDPEQFNPSRNAMERERIKRTLNFLLTYDPLFSKKTIIDTGCGSGEFSRKLKEAGASNLEAIDIAENALKEFRKQGSDGIQLKQEALPHTSLPDNHYAIIICTEVIAELPKEDYRLFFAELARLVNANGILLCSTGIDIDSEGGIEKLCELAQTEFDIVEDLSSYHSLYLKIKRFLDFPNVVIRGKNDLLFRTQQIEKRNGLNRLWYRMNSTLLGVIIWQPLNFLFKPLHHWLNDSEKALLTLEKINHFLSDERGISHYSFIGKKRPLMSIREEEEVPVERLKKKEIWE